MSTNLPKHDDFSPGRWAFSALSIATATALLFWNLTRLSRALDVFPWWLPLVVIVGMTTADFVSGLIHWAADTWGSETIPLLGRRLLHPFRVHHVNPDDFLRRRFVDTNGDVAFLAIPLLITASSLPVNGSVRGIPAVFIVAFCVVGLLANQVHQWAHMSKPPVVVRTLQDWGVILGRHAHQRHHTPPYAANYCIATGWCNGFLSAMDFFRRFERAVSFVTGLRPRHDDTAFQSEIGARTTTRWDGEGDRHA